MHRLWAVLACVSGSVLAADKLSIAPLSGDKGHAVEKQLSKALCGKVSCAPASKVMKGTKPDFKKAHRAGVDAVVTGKVHGGTLDISLTKSSQPKTPLFTSTLKLSKGHVAKGDLFGLVDGITGALSGADAPPPPPAEPPPAPPPAAPPPEETPEPPSKPPPAPPPVAEEPPRRSSPSRSVDSSNDVEAKVEPRRPRAVAPLVIGDVGLDVVGRSFAYDTLTAGNALAYQAPFIASPRLDVELYPAAHALEGIPQRAGISFDGAFAVGLKSQLGNGGKQTVHPSSLNRIDFGALLWLGNPNGASFAPELGYRLMTFSTSPAQDGSVLAGLPNVSYGALRISGAARVMATDTISVEGRASALPVLSAGQLISQQYFPKGGGFGFEVEAGVRVKIVPNVGVAVLGQYSHYGFSFSSQPTDAYQAKGASDQLYGGRVAAMFTY